MILILISFENKEHAEKVANYLVDNKMAACVTLIPIKSFYYWKDKKFTGSNEIEAIVKTRKENFSKIEKAVKKMLPYEVPQIIAIEVANVNKSYIEWLNEKTE